MKYKKFNAKDLAGLLTNSINVTRRNICGELIDYGLYRDVYVLKQNPDYVVKIERDMSEANFANATEWRNFINNRDWAFLSEWLAPCELINETSQIMIQRRVYWEGKKRKDYPTHVPGMFTDLKLKNFGWLSDGRFVCCDYSFMPVFIVQPGVSKLRYAKWWGSLKPKKLS